MNTVTIKNVVLGDGIPKICIPIVAKTKADIIEEAKEIQEVFADVVEWRVDWFEEVEEIEKVKEVLEELISALKGIPLLFTFRTSNEGGEKAIEAEQYVALYKAVIDTGLVDLIDVEAFREEKMVTEVIDYAHTANVKVIASNHDFEKTPSKEEIVSRLRKMQELGADIPKIAVMPKSKMDVLELLEATVTMTEQYADRPIITMSMGELGAVSRLMGEVFGSALTFGALKKVSAPGQIAVKELKEALRLLNQCLYKG